MAIEITHGWTTSEPDDPTKDVSERNLNDHQVTSIAIAGEDITSGTVADARIAATIARDSEVTSAVSTHAGAADPHGDRAFATSAVAALSTVYQPLDSDLTAIAALTTTSYGRAFLALADAAAGRTALGLGTAAVAATGDFDAAGAASTAQAAAIAAAATDATTKANAAQAASQPLDSDLTAIAALTTTSFGRGLLALADAAAGRTALGLGTAAVAATGDFDAAGAAAAAQAASQPLDSDLTAIAALTTTSYGRSLLAAADAAALRTLAVSVIGTDVEAHDADLTTIAGLSPTNDDVLQRKAGAWTNRTVAQLLTDLGIAASYQPLDSDLTAIAALTTTSFGRGLLALADAAAMRTSAGLGTLATQSGTFSGTSSGTNTGDQTLPTRASLGLDTTDSPQFAGVNVGAATDTTITRVSAGVIAVEGATVLAGSLSGDVSSSGLVTTIGSGKVTEAMQVLADNTTQNASTSAHGYLKKLDNVATHFMDGTGAWSTPAGGYYAPPTVTNYAAQFQASSTTCAVTVTAPTAGDILISVVFATGRGANSITQTNVVWTQRYTGNGNGVFLEVWTGVASASAGTTATAAFTGANADYVEVFTVNSAAAAFTGATAAVTGTAAGTALAPVSVRSLTAGSHVIVACSAGSATSSSYSGVSHDYIPLTAFGGLARSGILRLNATQLSYWSLSSSATAYFAAIVVLS